MIVGVLLPSPVPHLDRVFDYSVPEHLRGRAHFGVRVRVRFHGKLKTGFVVEVKDSSDVDTRDIEDVKGPPVLTPSLAELTRTVAERYVGTWSDVLGAAVPPRNARAERTENTEVEPPVRPGIVAPDRWPAWRALLDGIAGPAAVRAALTVPWGLEVGPLLVDVAGAVLGTGRRVLVVVPDAQDVHAAQGALSAGLPGARIGRLAAEQGPESRYRSYLNALAGRFEVLVGTRAAAFAQLPDLGLVWLWEPGSSALSDPQAPYWHTLEVCGLRSMTEGVDLVMAGRTRTPEVQRLVRINWAQEASPPRTIWRGAGPKVRTPDERDQERDPAALSARLPTAAFAVARAGLESGPVLVQVPRRGYVPRTACATCREFAACSLCGGALSLPAAGVDPICVRCAVSQPFVCPTCFGTSLRAIRIGTGRTADELRRALPHVPMVRSDADSGVIADVADVPALVVATPGAEPVAVRRYSAALILDGDAQLAAPRFRAAQDALARWATVASLVRADGTVLLVAAPASAPVQAFIRADPIGWAERELDDRTDTGLPPAVRAVAIEGPPAAAAAFVEALSARLPGVEPPLGPLPIETRERWILRLTYAQARAATAVLGQLQRERSAAREPVVTVKVDPAELV